jgi:hypothetical protein
LLGVLQKYNARGFCVRVIRGDFEFNGIEKHLKLLPSPPTTVWTSKDQHVGPIERNNRFTKEKARSMRCLHLYLEEFTMTEGKVRVEALEFDT